MDLSSNPKQDIEKCKGKLIDIFPNFQTFNINLNTFIPLSVNKLKNELSMDKSFKHLINYHFYNYLSKIREKKTNNFPIYLTFKNHLINILKAFGIKRDDIESKVNELKEGNISDINKEIINIIVKIKKKFRRGFLDIDEKDFQISENDNEDTLLGEDSNYDNNDNIYELKSLDILYYFYYCHKKNLLIPPISNETTNLLFFL